MRLLEDVETAALRDFYGRPPGEVHDVGGAACLVLRSVPVQWLNRVAGLGRERPATAADVDAIARIYGEIPHSVAVSQNADGLGDLLERRGYSPGYAWMKFSRGVEPLAIRPTDLDVRPAQPADAEAFAHVITAAYGFPPDAGRLAAQLPGRLGWHCYLAWDAARPVGAGALFIAGDAGWLGFAGTLPEARGRGAQNALLAARIDAAREHGCRVLAVETGVREPGRPDNSYRNILRAGFTEAGARPNYSSP